MIEKKETYSQIELLETGEVQLRKTTKIIEDGNIISLNHHRHIRVPGDDLSDLPNHISASISTFWCDEVVDEYNNYVSSSSTLNSL